MPGRAPRGGLDRAVTGGPASAPLRPPAVPRLADNIVQFGRILRRAGLPVGPDRVVQALHAVEAVGLARRDDVHAALSATLLDRHEQQAVFDAAFDAFWRDPKLLEQLMHAMLPKVSGRREAEAPPRPRRVQDALAPPPAAAPPPPPAQAGQDEVRFETLMSFSDRERLRSADFEGMSADEFAQAQALAERLPLPVRPVRRRRHMPAARGVLDLRATLQRSARQPASLLPAFRRPRQEHPPVVVLLDVSGSMDRYARVFLHYAHGLMRRHLKLHVFTFGTRLTNITRCLRERDPDVALRLAGTEVRDWKGGTRIGASLDEFNRRWARRVLGGNAALLLVTDGLDRDDAGALAAAAAQLQRLAHEVVWLNPLLRFDGFEPRAAGVRALLPHVDRFLPVHNLDSLAALGRALARGPDRVPRAWLAATAPARQGAASVAAAAGATAAAGGPGPRA
jgi:uncharacterized protein